MTANKIRKNTYPGIQISPYARSVSGTREISGESQNKTAIQRTYFFIGVAGLPHFCLIRMCKGGTL